MWKQLPNLYVNNSITVNHVPVNTSEQLAELQKSEDMNQPKSHPSMRLMSAIGSIDGA